MRFWILYIINDILYSVVLLINANKRVHHYMQIFRICTFILSNNKMGMKLKYEMRNYFFNKSAVARLRIRLVFLNWEERVRVVLCVCVWVHSLKVQTSRLINVFTLKARYTNHLYSLVVREAGLAFVTYT